MDIQTAISISISVLSLLFSIAAIVVSSRIADTDRINTNTWQTYTNYNSAEVRQGRAVARRVMRDPAWKNVKDYASYRAFFKLDEPNVPHQNIQDDQDLHYLVGFYHQVGILFDRKLLDKDFTMFLLGEALSDRWEVLGKIPDFYPNHPYGGMYSLYAYYIKWNEERFPQLINQSVEAYRSVEARKQAMQAQAQK